MKKVCRVTAMPFEVSDRELALRQKLGIEGEPDLPPVFRFMQLGAFWQHWNLYKRTCEKTGQPIISVYAQNCSYPVWHKDEWIKNSNPPGADFEQGRSVFEQMWSFFQNSPVAHNIGTGNQNCEYTDDCWYSKDCYLSHSVYKSEGIRYCYRAINMRDCQFCVFSFDSERCVDLINCHLCYDTIFANNCWNCRNSAFVYDCRNCSDCLLCTNLRNKKHCIRNVQLTKEKYEKQRNDWGLHSRTTYDKAKEEFDRLMSETAWHRALFIDQSENCTGNYLGECKNCDNCYFLSPDAEDCINVFRGAGDAKDSLDSIGPAFHSALIYYTVNAQDQCYDNKYCCDMTQCKWMEYCAHCFQCQHCFGCCGLVGKKYYIFNKSYTEDEYATLKRHIIDAMKDTKEYGSFFPGHFAATPYEETISGFYWPLHPEEIQKYGFRMQESDENRKPSNEDIQSVPDGSRVVPDDLMTKKFWDPIAKRPFQIQQADIKFALEMGVPLPNCYYAGRLQENFRRIPFDGTTRVIQCALCNAQTQTSWRKEYESRILCEKCYLKEVY